MQLRFRGLERLRAVLCRRGVRLSGESLTVALIATAVLPAKGALGTAVAAPATSAGAAAPYATLTKGEYEIAIDLGIAHGKNIRFIETRAVARATYEMPSVPGDFSDEPLDIGKVPVAPARFLDLGDPFPKLAGKTPKGEPISVEEPATAVPCLRHRSGGRLRAYLLRRNRRDPPEEMTGVGVGRCRRRRWSPGECDDWRDRAETRPSACRSPYLLSLFSSSFHW